LTSGNKKKAASLLRLKRTTFVEKLKRMGMDADGDSMTADELAGAE
jgi:DNA-binding NtrC family response regulator